MVINDYFWYILKKGSIWLVDTPSEVYGLEWFKHGGIPFLKDRVY